MIRIHQHRVSSSHKVTMAALVKDGIPFMVTLERPWKFNKPYESCAPAATYLMQRHITKDYPKSANAWRMVDVHGRTGMLWHSGNTINDSRGCTLPGTEFGELHGMPAVLNSRIALAKLMEITGGDDWELIIHEHR